MKNICKTCNQEVYARYYFVNLKQCKECFYEERRKKKNIGETNYYNYDTEGMGSKRTFYILVRNIIFEYRRKCMSGMMCAIKDLDKFFRQNIDTKEKK